MPLEVVAGIILRQNREVLITERPAGKSWAGFWEFPGGKVEAGETGIAALQRELQEELGIELQGERFELFHHGARGEEVVINFYLYHLQEEIHPKGLEGQRLQWLDIQALDSLSFPPPNTEVLEKLKQQFS